MPKSKLLRRISLPAAILIGLVALLILTGSILALIGVKPMRDIAGPDHIRLYEGANTSPSALNAAREEQIKDALASMRFTVLQGVLEGKFSYSYKFEMTTDDDGKNVKKELSASEVDKTYAAAGQYMIVYIYEDIQKMTVEGKKIEYDRLKIIVKDSANEVGLLKVIPYLDYRINNASDEEDISSEYYYVNPILIRANMSKALRILNDME